MRSLKERLETKLYIEQLMQEYTPEEIEAYKELEKSAREGAVTDEERRAINIAKIEYGENWKDEMVKMVATNKYGKLTRYAITIKHLVMRFSPLLFITKLAV